MKALLTALLFAGVRCSLLAESEACSIGDIEVPDGIITIDVMIADERKTFVLDVQSKLDSIDPSLTFGYYRGETHKLDNFLGRPATVAKSKTWVVGGMELERKWVALETLVGMKRNGRECFGRLTPAAFKQGRVILDFDQAKVIYSNTASTTDDFHKCKLKAGDYPIEAVIELDFFDTNTPFEVITWSNFCLKIPDGIFDKLVKDGHIVPQVLSSHAGATMDGVNQLRKGWFLSGVFMGRPLRGCVVFADNATKRPSVGVGWLRAFQCEVNVSQSIFAYKPREAPTAPVDSHAMIGMTVTHQDSGVLVWVVEPGGPAAKAGIKDDAQVFTLGGVDADKLTVPVVAKIAADFAERDLECKFQNPGTPEPVSTTIKVRSLKSYWNFSGLETPPEK